MAFLDAKTDSSSFTTEASMNNSTVTGEKKNKLLPRYSFKFITHKITDTVEYEVFLFEKFVILGRTIVQKYNFKTRYSKLLNLSAKLGEKGFPPKKIFGNKDQKFI